MKQPWVYMCSPSRLQAVIFLMQINFRTFSRLNTILYLNVFKYICIYVNMFKSVLSFLLNYCQFWASKMVLVVKNSHVSQCSASKRCGFNPWVWNIHWRRARQPTPVFLPGESPWIEELCRLQSLGSQRV